MSTPTIVETLEELSELRRKAVKTIDYQRLTVLMWFKEGVVTSIKEAAELLGLHRNTISRWLKIYKDKGLQEYQVRAKPGPTSQRVLPAQHFEALRERVNDPDGGFDSYVQAKKWLAKEHGIEVNYSTLHALMRREFGTRLKVPRPSHPKKNRKKSASSESNLGQG